MLVLDPKSTEPPFAQLRRQLTEQICGDRLSPGDRLPTVRRLAGDLGIAPNTVARAYRELEIAGLIEGRGRAGTFVSAGPSTGEAAGPVDPNIRDHAIRTTAQRAADSYVRQIRDLGLSSADALDLVTISLTS